MSDPNTILNWQRIDARLTTSGQPEEPELAAIAALGVRYVINLGLHSHPKALPDEAGSLAALGVAYIHQPVDFQAPGLEDFQLFCRTIDELNDVPVHVHCIMNYRVSAFIYRYRRDVLGQDDTWARAEMERIWRPEGAWIDFVQDRTL